ncbi:efflux RND transporter permease subunit [Limnobaculum zhutongyuii]|uniref:efflux RND transporter permease subunit n=2 Tax=Limnobaculum zhutongyuii TaxID=2498113 RepID=UPI0011597C4D|nr:efflux RND transporter permease subunit [Limnobaculum zhutongyuii]TQS91041.1 efflux RND transporter permease subunit [Limnobaculum zhutongyuii]
MNVSSWSINNPIPAILLFMLLTIIGLGAFNSMKIQSMPDVELPIVTVTATLQGAAPSQIETDIARKLENTISSVQDVKHIITTVQDGVATLVIEFRIEKSIQDAMDDVRDAVARVRSDLPAAMNEPIIAKLDLANMPVLAYAVHSAKMDDQALSWFVDNDIAKTLLNVKGVGSVNRVGGVTRQINVELSPERLLALQISAADISRQLKMTQQEASAGRADIGQLEQRARTLATVRNVDELANMNMLLSDGRQVRLNQIATVSDATAEQRSAAFLDGKPVVAVEVVRTKGGSDVDIMYAVREQLEELHQKHPDIVISEAFNFVDPTIENYEGSMSLLYEGAFLAIIVVWIFLRNWRATFVATVALPLSIIPTFAAMYLMGFTLNTVTLLSLSLVVGILVDDAIVEIENIMRHLSMGKTPMEAAREAADEIGLAVIATTFTLIAVFLPTAFMPGIVGRFFIQFGWTAAIAVFFSLVVARLLTPMMAAYMLKPLTHAHRQAGWERGFSRAASWAMKNRLKTVMITMLFFFGVLLGLGPLLPTGFTTPDDLSQTQVNITLPPGSRFEQTLALTKQAEAIVKTHPHVRTIYTTIGGGAAGGNLGDDQGPVMLANVATVTVVDGIDQIKRYDRRRTVDIEIELNGIPLGDVDESVYNLPSMKQLPPGIYTTQVGDAELMVELMSGFAVAMGTGVLCIFVVLVLLFKDFMQPVTILAALVLSVPGAILSLFLAQKAFSMPAMLGLIMLMGVATKNSILLVEYAIKARAEMGMARFEALVDAGKKRARPIVMTTFAMGGGMLPIALGLGVDPSFRSPMAIAVIGGLITSTFLSLIVIPVIFTYVDDLRLWGIRFFARLRHR